MGGVGGAAQEILHNLFLVRVKDKHTEREGEGKEKGGWIRMG